VFFWRPLFIFDFLVRFLVRTLENPSRGIAIHDSLFAKELTMLDHQKNELKLYTHTIIVVPSLVQQSSRNIIRIQFDVEVN
jgi:hypothetical protein